MERISCKKSRHMIFLIHGISGDRTHFGYMAQALPRVLARKDPSRIYCVENIEYETGNDMKTAYDFARDIAVVINAFVDVPDFSPEDKISLIMHSQGGLVGSIWMFQSLMGNEGFSDPKVLEQLDSFITLGTPFWGAKTAKWGSEVKALADRLGIEVPLAFGRQELDQMAFGSDLIFELRMAMIDPQYQASIQYLLKRVKFLNVVGVADLLNPLGVIVCGTRQYEDDGAVPLASARFDFLYAQSLGMDYADGDMMSLDRVREVMAVPYVVVNAMHRSPLPELENFPGIAQIPRRCLTDSAAHPVFPYLWRVLLGEPVEQMDSSLGDFKTFLLDFNVRVQADRDVGCDELAVEFFNRDGSPLTSSNIEIGKFFEFFARGSRTSLKYRNHCRFYFTGNIKRSLPNRKETILIRISAPGFKTRRIQMQLREGRSSFVDVSLAQKN